MSFLEKLQAKPKRTRTLILWTASILFMAIIVVVWFFSFFRSLESEKINKETEDSGLPSLFESIKKDFSLFKQGLQASFKKIQESADELNSAE